MNYRICSTALISLSLAGCGLFRHKPEPAPLPPVNPTHFVRADCGTPPRRRSIDFQLPTFLVLKIDGQQRFTLSPDEYKKLKFNMEEIESGVKELRLEIQFYLDCLSGPDNDGPDP